MIPRRLIERLISDAPFLTEAALTAALLTHPEIQAVEHPGITKARDMLKVRAEVKGDVATVPIYGVLARRPDPYEQAFYGVEDTEGVLEAVQTAASNPDVRGILLDVDSPGGFLTGGPEVADAVRQASKTKPVVAWTGGYMASLAYWIGSQASEVIASRSAVVGSIGVYLAMADYSKLFEAAGVKMEVLRNKEATFKAAGLTGTSLTDDQRSHLQERVQASFAEFKNAIKNARGDVPGDAMRGQTFTGREAKAQNLVDRVGDKAFAMGVLRSLIRGKG
jgi:signal peptide peptidase SppA